MKGLAIFALIVVVMNVIMSTTQEKKYTLTEKLLAIGYPFIWIPLIGRVLKWW